MVVADCAVHIMLSEDIMNSIFFSVIKPVKVKHHIKSIQPLVVSIRPDRLMKKFKLNLNFGFVELKQRSYL